MLNISELESFSKPYYANKDIMHNMWHIKLVGKMVDKILAVSDYQADEECLKMAVYFHGFIYQDELAIIKWMKSQNYNDETIAKTVRIAWESQRSEIPETIEGKILHDAHVLEGGRTYLVVKTLITGSLRGQSLEETLDYAKKNVIGINKCYLPETIPLCEEMNIFTNEFFDELSTAINS